MYFGKIRRRWVVSGMIGNMATLTVPIDNLILEQLARGEKRLLTLVVAVRSRWVIRRD